jgi:hypothetical protein
MGRADHIIQPKAGETIVVDAASGAVGSVVGQLAKSRGCRVVGLAGGADKCAYVTGELGFDVCIDYKQHRDFDSLATALDAAAPQGVDGLFENVGGLILDVVLSRMNAFGRVALCGMISGYDGEPMTLSNPRLLLTQRLKLQGFIVSEHMSLWPQALKELSGLVASGRLKYRETVAQGIAAAPEAFSACSRARTSQAAGEAGVNWTWLRFEELGGRQPVRRLGAALPRLHPRTRTVPSTRMASTARPGTCWAATMPVRCRGYLRVVDPGAKYAERRSAGSSRRPRCAAPGPVAP